MPNPLENKVRSALPAENPEVTTSPIEGTAVALAILSENGKGRLRILTGDISVKPFVDDLSKQEK